MDVTARIEMRPRRVGRGAVAARRRGVWLAAHTTRARHLNLIPGCVWSLASPAACVAAVASARTCVCVRTYPCACMCDRQSPFTHALPQTVRVTALVIPDGAQGARRGNAVRTCPLATFYRGVVRAYTYTRTLHVARGSRFRDVRQGTAAKLSRALSLCYSLSDINIVFWVVGDQMSETFVACLYTHEIFVIR